MVLLATLTSDWLAWSMGSTSTTVSVRSLAVTRTWAPATTTVAAMGPGVSNVGMTAFLLVELDLLTSRALFECGERPQVPDQGDPGAPGEGGGRVAARRGAGEQSTQRFDNRREGLVLRELPDTLPHLVGRHDRAAQERQQKQRHDGEACGFRSFRGHSQRDREPGGRESCRHDDADRAEPFEGSRGRPEPQGEGHSDDDRNGYRTAQHGGRDVAVQDGTAGDVH